MKRSRRWTSTAAPLAMVLGLATAFAVAIGAPATRAQDAAEAPHPAHIHTGSCADLGDVVQPLTDIEENTAGERFGADAAILVEESETDVPMSLSDILAAPHAINIHESADAIQNYIACGDVGGRVVDGMLLVGLQEINGSGRFGVARLVSNDDSTEVFVYLAEPGEAAAEEEAPAADTPAAAAETPEAEAETPEAAAPETEATDAGADDTAAEAAAEVAVDIRDFAFAPNPVEVPVGGTVTWTNQDAVPHTATAEQREVLQSGTISPGSSFSQVFDTAGEFAYFCEFHPNMTGTIVVQ